MNEIVKEYRDEIAERSITAKSYHAHNGNNGQKLGNRQLTNKEIEEKHGPVKTYTFDDFLTFTEFREMPLDWQAGYINYLQDKYDIGLTQINRDLFGFKDENSLRSHLKLKGVLDRVNPDKRRGRTKLHDFRRDIREYRMGSKKEEPEVTMKFEFVTWDKFKKFTRREQHLFINQVLDTYGRDIGIRGINRELFGKDSNSLRSYLIHHNFDLSRDFGVKNGGRRNASASIAKLRRDIAEWRDTSMQQEIDKFITEEEHKLNDGVAFGETLTANAIRTKIDLEPVTDKRIAFATSYISTGFDMGQIELIQKLFAGQKIKVEIGVEVL